MSKSRMAVFLRTEVISRLLMRLESEKYSSDNNQTHDVPSWVLECLAELRIALRAEYCSGYICFILNPVRKQVKIAFSTDPARAATDAQSGSADKLTLLGAIPCVSADAAQSLSGFFHALHIKAQWFSAGPEIFRYLAAHGYPEEGKTGRVRNFDEIRRPKDWRAP